MLSCLIPSMLCSAFLGTGTQPFVFYPHSSTSAYWQCASMAFHWLEATHSHESRSHLCLHIHRGLSVQHPFTQPYWFFFFLTLKMFQPAVHQSLKLRRPVWVFLTFLHVQLYQCVLKEDINFIICQRIPIASIYYAGCVRIGFLISRKAGEKVFP